MTTHRGRGNFCHSRAVPLPRLHCVSCIARPRATRRCHLKVPFVTQPPGNRLSEKICRRRRCIVRCPRHTPNNPGTHGTCSFNQLVRRQAGKRSLHARHLPLRVCMTPEYHDNLVPATAHGPRGRPKTGQRSLCRKSCWPVTRLLTKAQRQAPVPGTALLQIGRRSVRSATQQTRTPHPETDLGKRRQHLSVRRIPRLKSVRLFSRHPVPGCRPARQTTGDLRGGRKHRLTGGTPYDTKTLF